MSQPIVDRRYRILSKLGEGGMGAVFLALDERLDREVAVKRLHVAGVMESQREQFVHRFQREAKAMARFSHPNIVHVYDYGQDEDGIYLVLEYMPNGTLKQHLGKVNDPAEAARLLLPIAEALHYIHQRGMVHRDVKPTNILFDERHTPKLADFGIVKLLDQDGMTLTATGVGIGTPDYMAPEQVGKDFDHHVDQYALGIIFYELVTGKKPYQGDTPIQTLLKHVTEPLPDPRLFAPHLPESACTVIQTTLGKKPADRYADTGALIDGLWTVMQDTDRQTGGVKPRQKEEVRESAALSNFEDELPFDLPVLAESAEDQPAEAETRIAEPGSAEIDAVPAPMGEVEAGFEAVMDAAITEISAEDTAVPAAETAQGEEEVTAINPIEPEEVTEIASYAVESQPEEPTRIAAPARIPQAVLTAGAKKKFPWLWAGIGAAVVVLTLLGIFVVPRIFESPPQVPEEALSQVELNLTKVAEINQQENEPAEAEQNKPTSMPPTNRKGGWLDEIIVVYADWEDSIPRVASGELQISSVKYDQPFQLFEITGSNLQPLLSANLSYELTFNPAGTPTFRGNGAFNPFSSPEIRRAVNWLIDREFIAQEFFGGMAFPKWLPIPHESRDYFQFQEIREEEDQYRFEPGMAEEIIRTEMKAMGAVFTDEGWFYQDSPVVLKMIIRNDNNGLRIPIGEYIAGQFEQIGFQVEYQYMNSGEAYDVWFQGDPNDGQWHLYTGAWNQPGWVRDSGPDFQFYSSSASEYASLSPLWQAYTQNNPDYEMAMNLLAEKGYTSVAKRDDLMRQVIHQYFEAPYRLFLVQGQSALAASPDVRAAVERVNGGVFDLPLWPYTLRYADQEGGSMTVGIPSLFCELITAMETDCISDQEWLYAINDDGMMFNPKTQLPALKRAHSAAVTAVEGVPIRADESGVKLNFTDGIEVPGDAWVDWDVDAKQFITANQAFPEGRMVAVKSVVTYPRDLYETVTWHDSSPFSAADVIFHLIFQFERANERSNSYDPGAPSPHEPGIVAWRIPSTDPLTVEVYRDTWELDAANTVVDLWPNYGASEAPWHLITVSSWADMQGFFALTRARQEMRGIDRPMNWFDPECTGTLRELLTQELESAYIPYVATLADYISADEARMRYENLMNFYDEFGHFFVGTGPYQLTSFEMYGHLVLSHNPRYPDPADAWDWVMP